MNHKKWIAIAMVLILVLASVAAVIHIRNENERNREYWKYPAMNEGMVGTDDFYFDNDAGSWVSGSVFFYENGGLCPFVVLDFHLEPGISGMTVWFPREFDVMNVDSDYDDDGIIAYIRNREHTKYFLEILPVDTSEDSKGNDGTILVKMRSSIHLSDDTERVGFKIIIPEKEVEFFMVLPGK